MGGWVGEWVGGVSGWVGEWNFTPCRHLWPSSR